MCSYKSLRVWLKSIHGAVIHYFCIMNDSLQDFPWYFEALSQV